MKKRFLRAMSRWTILLLILPAFLFLTSSGVNVMVAQEVMLESATISGPMPTLDPNSGLWQEALMLQVPLAWQNITQPMLLGPSIRSMSIRSLNNGSWITFLVEWKDGSRDASTFKTELFRDAVAIMFPVLNGTQPPFLGMGEPGRPVNVWHWKADWQEDIDIAFQDLQQAYPDLWVDLYPFATPTPPYTVPPLANLSREYVAGWAAGNPLSQPFKVTPVEDLIAEGFGTLTHQSHQDVIGKGVWSEGTWKVVFSRPMATVDHNDAQFQPGTSKFVALAVWDGGNREVDGRKSFSNWQTIRLEESAITAVEEGQLIAVPLWRWIVVGATFLLSIALLLFVFSFDAIIKRVRGK